MRLSNILELKNEREQMRLIEKKLDSHPETFAPELLVTIAIPLAPIQDGRVTEDFYELIGKQLVDCVTNAASNESKQ